MNDAFNSLKGVLLQQIISPVVWLLIIIAFTYFLWGLVGYLWKGENPSAREDGQRHMIYGIIGLAIMISVFGIMHFIFSSVTAVGGSKGINNQTVNEPSIDRGFGN